jgi:hypothetical protein
MKRIFLLLAVLLAFGLTAVAQDAATSSSSQASTSTTTKSKKSKSTSSDSSMASDSGSKSSTKASGKSSQLTGCVSSAANSEGNYTLTNGKYKKGVELIPGEGSADISNHAGHQVQLTGKWTTESAAKDSKPADATKYDKHFEVASIKHMSDTCPTTNAKAGSKSDMPASTTKGKNKKSSSAMTGSDTSNPK